MFRLIKIIFNAFLLVLAVIGFNAVGGQRYVEAVKTSVIGFMQHRAAESAKTLGNFSNLHEEFQIDNTVNLFGYKAVISEHKVSGQKMCIIDSGKKPLLTQDDIKGDKIEKQMEELISNSKYPAVSFQEIKVVSRGTMNVYGQNVPYAKFEAKSNKLPFSDLAGVVSSVKTSDGSEKLAIAVSEKKRYSQLITDEFFKGVSEN